MMLAMIFNGVQTRPSLGNRTLTREKCFSQYDWKSLCRNDNANYKDQLLLFKESRVRIYGKAKEPEENFIK